MRRLLLALLLVLLPGGAWALDPWAGCDFLTAGAGTTIVCPDTVTGGATITAGGSSGAAPADALYWVGAPDATLSNEIDLSALATGLVINTAGVPSAYAGASCTNQFVRSLNASGAATCNTVQNADLANSSVTVNGTTDQINTTSASIALGGSATLSLATPHRTKTCVVTIGDPGAASAVLQDDNDSPVACPNNWGVDWTITAVGCYADAGSPTVTPILTGGTSTSILSGALTCGTAAWAAGSVNGSPVVKSFSGGATCSSTPCSADVNITSAGGTAKYIVVKITGTLP